MKVLLAAFVLAFGMAGSAISHAAVLLDTTYNWSGDGSEGDQISRIYRSGVGSTWAAPKLNPGTIGGETEDYVSFAVNAGIYSHIQVTYLSVQPEVFAVAYSSYNPLNPAQNYLADPGFSGYTFSFQFIVAPGSDFDIVLSTVLGVGSLADNQAQVLVEGFIGDPGQTPLPAAVWMFGGGLLGVTMLARRRRAATAECR